MGVPLWYGCLLFGYVEIKEAEKGDRRASPNPFGRTVGKSTYKNELFCKVTNERYLSLIYQKFTGN